MEKTKVTTKFMAATSFTDHFDTFDQAKAFVDREVDKLRAFYKSLRVKPNADLKVEPSLNMQGDMIVKVFHPIAGLYNVQANFLVIFRIEKSFDLQYVDSVNLAFDTPIKEPKEQLV